MSTSTGAVQRPIGQGSFVAAIALGVATIFVVGVLASGALGSIATRRVVTPVAAPILLDRGSRDEGMRFTYGEPEAATPGTVSPISPDQASRDEGMRFTYGKPEAATQNSDSARGIPNR